MIQYTTNQKASIDIHHMTREEAKRYLIQFLNKVDGSVQELEVIHGWSGGTVLKDMVQKGLRHPKIRAKVVSMNPGITILLLQAVSKSSKTGR